MWHVGRFRLRFWGILSLLYFPLLALGSCALGTGNCSFDGCIDGALTLTAISPGSGSTNGATLVTLTGSGFGSDTSVKFSDSDCEAVTAVSSQQLTCLTPARPAGTVDVTARSASSSMTLSSAFTYILAEITSWLFIDGNGEKGINKDKTKSATTPQATVFNSKLYATWAEDYSGSNGSVRVAVYSGIDSAASWSLVDGGGELGLNAASAQDLSDARAPQLTAFSSKLYAAWQEWTQAGSRSIHVAVYNANDLEPAWSFVDAGLNTGGQHIGFVPQLAVHDSKLYAIWTEAAAGTNTIRVKVYNGNDGSPAWAVVDGNGGNGINKDASRNAENPQLVSFNGKLYATWEETNGSQYQIRVRVYNGDDGSPTWTFVDGNGANGINKDVTRDAQAPQLFVSNSKLYVTWHEQNTSAKQIRVVVYNGNDSSPAWTFVDGNGANGINKDPVGNATKPTVFNDKIYLFWSEANGTATQIRVAVYNGNDSSPQWTFLDGDGTIGLNKDVSSAASTPHPVVHNFKLYGAWSEVSGVGQIRVVVGR